MGSCRIRLSNNAEKLRLCLDLHQPRGFPTNVNVAAALSLAGIEPDRTQMEIWADPGVTRNTHTITVDADTARFTMTIENVPSENPRTGKSVAPSTVAALRALVSELKVGS